jgi:RNA polymerase sigma-70 factor (ECF subfamily)
LGKTAEARTAYEQALVLAEQEPEQRFIEQQLASLSG